MRVLVVGGAGFIGSHLSKHFLDAGHALSVFDTVDTRRWAAAETAWEIGQRAQHFLAGASFVQGDAADRERLHDSILRFDPDCICYLAAMPLVGQVELNPAEATRSMIIGLTNCLEIIRGSQRTRRLLYVSSSMVYGNFTSDPLPEDAPTVPINVYGSLKLAGEVLTRTYLANTRHEFVVARPSGVYGPTDVNGRVVQKCCEAAMTGAPFTVTDPENTFVDFTWVDDLTHGLAAAATAPAAAGETFNLTFGRGRSLSELVDLVKQQAGGLHVVRADADPLPRPRRGTLDISKAKHLLGYAPRTSLERGVEQYFDFLRSSQRRAIADA